MAGFGSLGGLGGFGTSYPARFGKPRSEHIQTLEELQKPLHDAFNASDASRREQDSVVYGQIDNRLAANNLTPGSQTYDALRSVFQSAGLSGGIGEGEYAIGELSGGNGQALQKLYDDLEAIAQPFRANETRQQQAYDSMRNWGQENAVIGPNYSRPGFGQINGISGDPYAPQGDLTGIDMSWADGFYNPQGPGSGVYSPSVPRKNNGWGLW